MGGRVISTLAEKSASTIWGLWYANKIWAEMGNGTESTWEMAVARPVLVSDLSPGGAINNPLQVTCGYQFGAALATNGTVWDLWQRRKNGELGNG